MRNLNRKICFFLMVLLIFILLPEVKIKAIDDIQIISSTKITANEAKIWAKRKGATDTFIGLADLYWKYSSSNGNVNPAVAYVQAAVETGYGKFGGVIDESYKNPCGMKTTQGGSNTSPSAHQRFNSWDDGVKAHLDHLALYAGAIGYPRKNTTDPRHFSYILGNAKTVQALSGTWASNINYGNTIMNLYNSLMEVSTGDNSSGEKGVVVIDAGHGGTESGAVSGSRIEKNINLSIALKTESELKTRGYTVKMVRTNDSTVALNDRAKFANDLGADLFISIHQNYFTSSSANGTEIYYTTSKPDSGFPTQSSNKLSKSKEVAKLACNNIASAIGTYNRGIKDGDFTILRNTKMPSILIECGFITNTQDALKISSDNYQNKIAKAIGCAIDGENYTETENSLQINSFVAQIPSPQVTGTKMNLTAQASGTGTLQYKFLLKSEEGNWYLIRDYSSSNTCEWQTDLQGNKILYVDVKDSYGNVARKSMNYEVKPAPKPQIINFITDKKSPQITGTKVNLIVEASGTGTLQYKFLLKSEEGNWYLIRDYASSNTCEWQTGLKGNKVLYVDVKDSYGNIVRKEMSYIVEE